MYCLPSDGPDGVAVLRATLDRLWERLAGGLVPDSELRRLYAECLEYCPDTDSADYVDGIGGVVQNAVISVALAVKALLESDLESAMFSASHVYEPIRNFVMDRDALDARDLCVADPLVQAEIARQFEDASALLRRMGENEPLDSVRSRSVLNAKFVFRAE